MTSFVFHFIIVLGATIYGAFAMLIYAIESDENWSLIIYMTSNALWTLQQLMENWIFITMCKNIIKGRVITIEHESIPMSDENQIEKSDTVSESNRKIEQAFNQDHDYDEDRAISANLIPD